MAVGKHIGLIGGIGPAATEFYYRGIVRAHASVGAKLSLTIAHADVREMVENMDRADAKAQAALFTAHVEQLRGAGCEAVAVTSMGGHFCIRELERTSSLPVINAIPALDAHFRAMGVKRIGLLGSKAVMEFKFYGGVSSVEVLSPAPEDIGAVHATYVAMAMVGSATPDQRHFFDLAARKLRDEQAADAIVLAGTDLFLAFDGLKPDYPVVDSAEIHIREITRHSLGRA